MDLTPLPEHNRPRFSEQLPNMETGPLLYAFPLQALQRGGIEMLINGNNLDIFSRIVSTNGRGMRCSISSNSMFFYQLFPQFWTENISCYIVVVFQVVHLYQKLLTGMRKAPPRWQFCAEITHKFFGHLLNSLLHRWSTLHLNCFELVDTDVGLIREQMRELGARESEVQRIFAGLRQAVSSQVLAHKHLHKHLHNHKHKHKHKPFRLR